MQEVIIYRTPIHAAFWHYFMNGGYITILTFGGVLFGSFIIILGLLDTLRKQNRNETRGEKWSRDIRLSGILSIIISILVILIFV